MLNLVVQSFGKESELRRAALAVLSFFAQSTTDIKEVRVVIFTDNKAFFDEYLSGLPLHFVLLTPEKVRAMRGKIDFLHRMKIAMIEEVFQSFSGNLLYFDSDTFFIGDPMPLVRQLSPDRSFMHVHEYVFEEMKYFPLPGGATFQAYYELIANTSFLLADGTEYKISTGLSSWNAGVMMFHESHKRFIPDVYALTEQTYPLTKNHASEQYAFSILLQTRTALSACEPVIYHYWYRIKKQIVDEFLVSKMTGLKGKSLEVRIATAKEWTDLLPGYFQRHVLTLRDNAIQEFNENRFFKGYAWAAKAMMKQPLGDKTFVKDVLYHFKRQITRSA